MKSIYRVMWALMAGLLLISATAVFAQDWPQWRGANRDGKVTGFTAPQTWPKELVKKWSVPVGLGDATPALVGDKLYVFTRVGDEEITQCLNASDGKQVWQDKYTAQVVTGGAAGHPGPRSMPTVADGKVVTLGVGGILSCFDAATGKLLWRKDEYPKVVPMFFTSMAPIITDVMVIAQLGGKGNGGMIAYDLATGDPKWRWTEEGPEYASPILMTVDGVKQVVALTDQSIVGVSVADGKLLWKLPFVPAIRKYNAATPMIDGNTVIYTGAGRGTKAVKIEKKADGFVATELWSNPDLAPQYNNPVLVNGFIYGISDKGLTFCINAKTGVTAWTDTIQRDRGGFGTVLNVGTVLLALTSNGELAAIAPSEKEYTELARIKVADTPTYAGPIVAGKRIFIKDKEALTLWMME